MHDHKTDRTIYVLAAISVLLFVISFLFERHAALNLSNSHDFEPPRISVDQKIGGSG